MATIIATLIGMTVAANAVPSYCATKTLDNYLKTKGYELSTIKKTLLIAAGALSLTCLNGAALYTLSAGMIAGNNMTCFAIGQYLGLANILAYAGVAISSLLQKNPEHITTVN